MRRSIWMKRLPTYASIVIMILVFAKHSFSKEDVPPTLHIFLIATLLLTSVFGTLYIIRDIRMLASGARPVSYGHKGLYVKRKFIHWEKITEFRLHKVYNNFDAIGIVTSDAEEQINATRNPAERLFLRLSYRRRGYINIIDGDDFSGKASEYMAFLEELKLKYGKKQEFRAAPRRGDDERHRGLGR